MMVVVDVSLAFCAVIYILVGVFGVITYQEQTEADVLRCYGTYFTFVPWIKLAFAFVLSAVFPIWLFVCRNCTDHLIFGDAPLTTPRRIGIGSGLSIGAVTVGILCQDVGVAFGFTGSVAAVLVMYIFPALFYLKVERPAGQELSRFQATVAKVTAVCGVVIMFLCTGVTVYTTVAGN